MTASRNPWTLVAVLFFLAIGLPVEAEQLEEKAAAAPNVGLEQPGGPIEAPASVGAVVVGVGEVTPPSGLVVKPPRYGDGLTLTLIWTPSASDMASRPAAEGGAASPAPEKGVNASGEAARAAT